jgi:hypothetical protein
MPESIVTEKIISRLRKEDIKAGRCENTGCQKWRYLEYDLQGKKLCSNCAQINIYQGYKVLDLSKIKAPKKEPLVKQPKAKKIKVKREEKAKVLAERKKGHKYPGVTEEVLRSQVLEALKDSPATNIELLERVAGTKSSQRVASLLSTMKKEGLVIGEKTSPQGNLHYALPCDRALLIKKLGSLVFQEEFINLIPCDRWIAVSDLVVEVKRPRPTVVRWITDLLDKGAIECKTQPIKGRQGIFRSCKRIVT